MPDFPKPDPAVARLLNVGLRERGLSSGVYVQKDPRWERVLHGVDRPTHRRVEGRIMGTIASSKPAGYRWRVGLSLSTTDELEAGNAPTFDDALAVANKIIDAYDAADRLSGGSSARLCGKCGMFLSMHTKPCLDPVL